VWPVKKGYMIKEYDVLNRQLNLSDYIRVYDNALTADQCQSLINSFDAATEQQYRQENEYHHCTEINVSKNDWDIADVFDSVLAHKDRYWEDCYIGVDQIPAHDFEEFRMRCYHQVSGDRHVPHCDVMSQVSAKRFLGCIWNLNDVEEGGELVFYRAEKRIEIRPRAGQLIMFPTNWMMLRAELPTKSSDRYSLQTFYHYKEPKKDD